MFYPYIALKIKTDVRYIQTQSIIYTYPFAFLLCKSACYVTTSDQMGQNYNSMLGKMFSVLISYAKDNRLTTLIDAQGMKMWSSDLTASKCERCKQNSFQQARTQGIFSSCSLFESTVRNKLYPTEE